MTTRRKRNAGSLVRKSTELGLAVPLVMAHRLTRMAMAGRIPSARDRKEFDRMVQEKGVAFRDSWNAMAMQAFRAQHAFSVSLLSSFWAPPRPGAKSIATRLHRDALGILDKGLAPVHRKAVANARRLARTRLR